MLDGGDSWGDGCGHSSGGVSESGVSVSGGGEVLRVGLGVSLTLDQMGWSSGAVAIRKVSLEVIFKMHIIVVIG